MQFNNPKLSMTSLRRIQEHRLLVARILFDKVYQDIKREVKRRTDPDVYKEEQVIDLFCIRFNLGYMEHSYRIKLVEYKMAMSKYQRKVAA